VFYKEKGKGDMLKTRILSYGFNLMGDINGINSGIHAECDALRKLPPNKNKKKLKIISLLVVRISGKNKLQSSKPCFNCIKCMKTLPLKLGYKIQNIYYSNNEGFIIKSDLDYLDNDEKHYSRFYRQKMTNVCV
jgi:hypothetical protein